MNFLASFRRFPLLATLFFIQLSAIELGVFAAMAILSATNTEQNNASFVRAKELIFPDLVANHERWRALKHLDMDFAVQVFTKEFLEKFRQSELKFFRV